MERKEGQRRRVSPRDTVRLCVCRSWLSFILKTELRLWEGKWHFRNNIPQSAESRVPITCLHPGGSRQTATVHHSCHGHSRGRVVGGGPRATVVAAAADPPTPGHPRPSPHTDSPPLPVNRTARSTRSSSTRTPTSPGRRWRSSTTMCPASTPTATRRRCLPCGCRTARESRPGPAGPAPGAQALGSRGILPTPDLSLPVGRWAWVSSAPEVPSRSAFGATPYLCRGETLALTSAPKCGTGNGGGEAGEAEMGSQETGNDLSGLNKAVGGRKSSPRRLLMREFLSWVKGVVISQQTKLLWQGSLGQQRWGTAPCGKSGFRGGPQGGFGQWSAGTILCELTLNFSELP